MTKDEILDAIDLHLENKKPWVYLTEEEHMQLADEWGCLSADWVFYAGAIERKIKEKNAEAN